jgi:hypothetical protein
LSNDRPAPLPGRWYDMRMRRHVVPAFLDFDYRANALREEINENWEEAVKEAHRASRAQLRESLGEQYGTRDLERKVADFIAVGPLISSVIAYHNAFLRQVRDAFASGYYYPALTGACALGERILNHLVLDLRDDFRGTPEYKVVHRKESFQDWELAVSTLEAWRVLVPAAAGSFRELAALRHRSLHFSTETYLRLREDALAAIGALMAVVQNQFSAFGTCPWFVPGTPGTCFIKHSYERDPFVRRYYLPLCPKVGPRFAWSADHGQWLAFDFVHYDGERDVTDEEFRDLYNERDPRSLAPTVLPAAEGVICMGLRLSGPRTR